MKIAIIGAGISGNLAARLLATRHQVVLCEAGRYAGGHSNTVDVSAPRGRVAVDTGFMVYNCRTYPNFSRMLELLEVDSQASDMSFSVSCKAAGLEYNGSSLNGLFAQRRNLVKPCFYRMIYDIMRFNQAGEEYASTCDCCDSLTLGQFLNEHQLGPEFRHHYLVPMLAAIWSAAPDSVEHLPARFILGFMHNHGLMQLRDRPQWRTIVGGARRYVQALLAPIVDSVRLETPIVRIERQAEGVDIYPANSSAEHFDAVVLATHADQSLAMLADATTEEREILGALPYQSNTAVLHSDLSQMPDNRRAWASWNYRIPDSDRVAGRNASVTYDLNRLQNLSVDEPVFVTLNPCHPIKQNAIHQTMTYHHPAYTLQSVAAQRRWEEINGVLGTWYCGAYWGYGFHEDGVNSALRVAKAFGVSLEDLASPLDSAATRAQHIQSRPKSQDSLVKIN